MHLNRLVLRNFKKYRRAEISFQDGLTGITGMNGAGKSTIVEAMAWALYGSKASAIKRDLIKNSNAKDTDSVEVSLSLSHGKQEITILRAMKGKSLSAEAAIDLDGHRVAMGSRDVDLKLEEILKISYQDFMRTFYARQKDLDNLLKEGGTGKREYLLKLLGLDDVRERSMELMKSDLRKLEDHSNRLRGALAELGNIDARIEDTSKRIASAKAELSDLKKIETNLALEAEKRKHELDEQIEKQRAHVLLDQKISDTESKASEKEKAITSDEARIDEIDRAKETLADLEPDLKRLEFVKARLGEIEPKRKKYDGLQKTMIIARTELDLAGRSLAEQEKLLESLKQDRSALENIKPMEAEYQKIIASCERLEALRDRYTELQAMLNGEKIRLESIQANAARADETVRNILLAKGRIEKIQPLKEKCEQLQKEFIHALRQKDLQKELDSLNVQKSNLEARIQKLENQITSAKKDLAFLGDLALRDAELKRQDVELDRLGMDLNNELADLKGKLAIVEAQRIDASKTLAKVKSLGKESNCPTCERPIGEQYFKLVQKYELLCRSANEHAALLKKRMQLQIEKINGVSSARSKLKIAFDDLNAKRSRRAELFAGMRSLESQISEAKSELKEILVAAAKLGDVSFDPKQFDELQKSIEDLIPYVEEHRSLAFRLVELPKREMELGVIRNEERDVLKKLEEIGKTIEELGYVESDYLSQKKRLLDLAQIHNKFELLARRVQEIPRAEEKVNGMKSDLKKLENTIKSIQGSIEDLGFDPAEYDSLSHESRTLAKAEETAQQIRLKIASEEELRERLADAMEDLTRLKSELSEIKKQIFSLGYSSELHQAVKKALDDVQASLEAARKETSNSEIRLRVLESDLQRLEGDAGRKKVYEKELAETGKKLQVVDVTKSVVNSFMDHILIRIRDDIAYTAGLILEEVSGKYSLLKIDDDFNILVEDGGEYYPISRYSGGEVDMIAVSVRVAISEYLMRFSPEGESYSFLILDEIFGSQDMEHREKMINMLRSLQERFPQIIAISHISDVQGQFDNTINVIEDDLGNSRVEIN
ncbi:MAG: AAA family ATPase [Methanotrichaceae archaeon]